MDEYETRKYRKAERSGYKKGIKIGEANGIKIGEANGIKIGEANGVARGIQALRMMQSGAFSEAQIIEATGLTQEQLQTLQTACTPQK